MQQLIGLLKMLMLEHMVAGDLVRKPEELLVMDAQDQVVAWHEQGADEGPIAPVYHLNALACGDLTPIGGTVVDLGCGSGRFATYLARYRPDLKIIGYDLSEPMVEVGNTAIRAAGLNGRVELRVGDMTSFSKLIPKDTSTVSCVFAMHHLPDLTLVKQCFEELHAVREKYGSAIWIFDLARPRHERTAHLYPEVFTPEAPEVFKLDSTNSLLAAYSHQELKQIAQSIFGENEWQAIQARWFPLYQAYWLEKDKTISSDDKASNTEEVVLSKVALSQYRGLRFIMPGLPGQA